MIDDDFGRRVAQTARSHIYVDYPVYVLRGNKRILNRAVAIIIVMWRLFGALLALPKAIFSKDAAWIGRSSRFVNLGSQSRFLWDAGLTFWTFWSRSSSGTW